jgi:addiction module HigA family antidote
MNGIKVQPVSPGELLNEDFLLPLGITKCRLAKEIGVPPQRISAIVSGKRSVTADTDLRLCTFLGLSSGYWLRVQAKYDTEMVRGKIQTALNNIRPLRAAG